MSMRLEYVEVPCGVTIEFSFASVPMAAHVIDVGCSFAPEGDEIVSHCALYTGSGERHRRSAVEAFSI